MAENLLSDIVEKLIGKLCSLAVESWNVRDDLGKLMDTVSEIKAILLDAEERQSTSHQSKVWLEKLKDALDDAEDLFDDFSYEETKREVMPRHKKAKVSIFFSSSNQILFSIKMASKIKEIGKKLEALNVEGKRFHFTSRTLEQRVKIQRETHSFIPEEVVIGREKEKEEVVEFLLNSNNMKMTENVSIISIIGFGGLGKTALAQLAYNDKAVQGHFELKMWVCVSDEFEVKAIAKKIIGSQTNDEIDRVQQELRKKIEGKRYLLVLDDIWNDDRVLWLELKPLLMDGGKGSKIVITTRSEKVAKISDTSSAIFLKGLDEEQSWKLFAQSAFPNGKEPENQNVIAVGKEIVRKCAGVPLAIRGIGSLMYSKESERDWLNFKDQDLVKIDEQGDKRVFQLIKLSYDHLPFYLKKCFSFCSVFPKDYFITRPQLIRLWVAQGFVESSDDSISLEDVGNEYFMSLAHRSFFQDTIRDSFSGDVRSCKMHDLVHDLATMVAGKDCVIVNENGKPIGERTRHLSFGFHLASSMQVPSSFRKASKLRTFLLPEQECNFLASRQTASDLIMSSFERLRVLDLHDLNSRMLMLSSCFDMLKHLRYLDLSNNKHMEMLPGSITKLHNLQTLLLNRCSKLKELPRDLWKLIRLRHLELNGCDRLTCMPRGIGQLTNLQTLSRFVLNTSSRHSGGARELSGLNNLRGRLEIRGLECLRCNTTEAEDIKLREKSCLEALTLTWGTQRDADDSKVAEDDIILEGLHPHHNIKQLDITGFGGVGLSGWDWVNSLTNLVRISISECTRLQTLPPLHLLSHLKDLGLRGLPCLEWVSEDGSDYSSSTFFPALKRLYLELLPNLRGWWRCSKEEVQGGRCHQFESLDELNILGCPKLSVMPRHPSVSDVWLLEVSGKILQHAVDRSATAKLEVLRVSEINDFKSMSVQHLTALRHLAIEDCEELDLCNDEDGGHGMQWKELKNLIKLDLIGIPKMESLPEGLQHVTTLKDIYIHDCANLTYLPEWIASLGPSLAIFTIVSCPNLTSLPEGMRHLTSLQTLTIYDCPQLEERCWEEVGQDWHKISHVPNFTTAWF